MANNGGNITFGIDFNVNKSGLNDLKKSLQDIQKSTSADLVGNLGSAEAKKALEDVKRSASEIEKALQKAYNPTINSVNVSKFNQQLSKTHTNLNTVYQNFSKVQGGSSVFRNLTTELLTTNMQLKETHSLLDSMGQTMVNTVKWSVASSVMNAFTGSIQNAYNYVRVLDSSLTDIRIVTGQSREEMDRFAESANRAAQNLGRQTKDYTNAALSFYQQGLSDDEVAARTETTLKAANITGAGISDMANQLTAVWNGFQVGIGDTENVVSKLAAVADSSASNMSELATAMSKAASVANNMGVDVDQLSAQIATIIATTRQAPETVGNALKTIYARINDIKAGSDEAQVSLGNYTGKMAALGIQVLDQQGNLRDTGQVMEEIGDRWGDMTRQQQIYLAQTMAGQRQMNNLIALFDNWDMYTKELNISLEAQGTLNEKNARYMESLEAHTRQLTAASEGLIQAFVNGDSFKGFIDIGTNILQLLTSMVDSIGGGGTAILGFGSILTRVFSKQISGEISSFVLNLQAMRQNAQALAAQKDITNLFKGVELNDKLTQNFIDLKSHVLGFGSAVTTQQHEILNSLLKERNELENQKEAWDENKRAAEEFYQKQTKNDIGDLDKTQKFTKVLFDLKKIQKQAASTMAATDALSNSIFNEGFSKDVDSTMSPYIKKVQELVENKKVEEEVQQALNQSLEKYQQILAEVKASGASEEDLLNNQDVRTAASQLLDTVFAAQQQIKEGAERTAKTVQKAVEGTSEKYRKGIQENERATKDFISKIDVKGATQSFVNLAGSVAQVGFAVKSTINLFETLKDDSLTPMEKMLQVITNLSMTLPMFISGIEGAATAIKGLGVAFNIAGVESATLWIGAAKTLAVFAPYAAAIAVVTGAIYALVKAYNKQSNVAKNAQENAEKLRSQYKDLKSSYEELKDSIEDYQDSKKALSELEAGTSKWKDKVEQLNQKVLDLVKIYPELANQVSNVNGQLEISEKGIQDLIKAQEIALQNSRMASLFADIQANKAKEVARQTEVGRGISYQVDADVIQTTLTVPQKTISELVDGINKNGGLLNSEVLDNLGITNQNLRNALLKTDNRTQLQDLAKEVLSNTQATNLLTDQYIQSLHNKNSDLGVIGYDESERQGAIDALMQKKIRQYYDNTTKDKYLGPDLWDSTIQKEWVNRNSNLIDSQNLLYNKGRYTDINGNTEEISDFEIRQKLALQDAERMAQASIYDIIDQIDLVVELGNNLGESFEGFGDIAAKMLQAQNADDIVDLSMFSDQQLEKANLADTLNFIWDAAGIENSEVYSEAFLNSVKAHFAQQAEEIVPQPEKIIPSNIGGFRQGFEKYQKGTLKDDQLEQFEGILSSLQEAYPSLIEKVQILRNSWLEGTDEYQQALSEIEDTLSYNMINATAQASDAAAQAWKEIFQVAEENQNKEFWDIYGNGSQNQEFQIDSKVKAKIDLELDEEELAQFQQQLNTILDAERTIDVEIHTDAEQAFEGIQSKFDQIQAAASRIGQGFIVAADDMRELNNVFPGIMQGMQMLENGTYQLNEDIVSNVTNAVMAEAAAETESVRQRLQSQAELLHAKAQSYQTIADAAAQLASSEVQSSTESAQLQTQISDELTRLKQINSDLAATKENADQKSVADSSQANAAVMANNWAGAANSAAQSIYQFAANAAHNMKAVAEGNPDQVVPPGNISSIFGSGQSGVNQQLSIIEAAENTISVGDVTKEAFANMAEQFQAMADASEQAANDIDGMLAEIGGNVNDIVTGIQDVQAGKAYGSTQKDTGDKKSSGGGKKGSGGGKKEKEEKSKSADQIEKKKLKDEQIDRYHELDRAIKDVQEAINDLNKAEGKTVRNGLSQTIDKQIAALEQQKGLYEQKLNLMQADLQVMQAELGALGVQFDEQGNIINYTALMIEYQTIYNQLLEEAKLLTGETQQAKLAQAEAVKAKLDSLKSQMNAYEALQDKIVDAGNAIQDILDKEEELRIKQFKIKIDWELDKAQAERDWNEFRKKVIDRIKKDDYLGQARARLQDFHSYYKPDGGGIIQELTEHVNRTRQEAEIIENGGESSIYGKNQAQALEDLKHYNDELMQALEDVEDIIEDIHQLYLDTIDKAKDAFDEQIDTYEQIDSIIQHDLNLIQMLNPNDNEEELAHYYQLRAENNNQEIDFYRKQRDMWKQFMDAAEEGTEEWKKFRDNWMESVSSMNDAVEAAVQNLLDKYQNTISKIIRDTKNQIVGGDWQKALDEWDRAKWFDDRYLDLGSRATGVLDFVSDVNKAMQGVPVKQQQQLLKFMDSEVSRLNDLTRIRQIDLDIASKKLEVLQKQMALEDAQQNKTQLRLRRDSQGNYSYQYVADQDQIASKQQELRDVLEELRQLAKTDVSETIDAVEDKLTEFFERAQELNTLYYDDTEVLQEKLLALQEEYFGPEGYISLLGIDYNLMQGQLLEATGAQFSQLYRQQGEELAAFLGLNTDDESDSSVWGSIKALLGAESGAIPTLLDIFTTKIIPDNFEKMGEANQQFLFGENGLNPSWDTALGRMTTEIGNFALNYYDKASGIYSLTDAVTNGITSMVLQGIYNMTSAMVAATSQYANDLRYLEQVAGIAFSDIRQGIDATIGETRALIQDNGTLIGTYQSEISAIQAVVRELEALCGQYAAARDAAIAAAEAALKFWAAAQGQAADVSLPRTSSGSSGGGYVPSSTPAAKPSSGNNSGGNGGNNNSSGSSGTKTSSIPKAGEPGFNYVGVYAPTASGIPQVQNKDFTIPYEIIKPNNKSKLTYATGGYTGEWANGDNEGRIAFLHQKELVLNAEDTKNILSAVDLVRKLTNQVAGLNGLAFGNLPSSNMSSITNNSSGNKIEQSVIIHANFPDVSDAAQIKRAFDNLVNIAVMRANQR